MILLWQLFATAAFPLVALVVLLHPRLRPHWRERLGLGEPEVEPGAVWIHAASLGEGRIAAALAPAIRVVVPGVGILRTCTSDVARPQQTGADQSLCLPVDVPFVVGNWLDRVRPRCLILVEAELWPSLLAACHRRHIPVALVAPREGPGMKRLGRIPGLRGLLLHHVKIVSPEADLKAAAPVPLPRFGWSGDAVVAGCTHEGEEEMLLDAVAALPTRPLLVLAPRDPRRFDDVARLLDGRDLRWIRRTQVRDRVPADVRVLLLDTVGELSGLYTLGRAAFIGGTFKAHVGGHSPAEAAAAGCPIVHGPFTESNARAWAKLETFPVLEAEELPEALMEAMASRKLVTLPAQPQAPPPLLATPAGRVLSQIDSHLVAPTPAERALRPLLWPLVPLWWLGTALRPRPELKLPLPVISVGGITAGGAGKTPVAAWFATTLAPRAPVVASRGYGRRGGDDVRLEGEALDIGDELAMLARRGIRVASCPDRGAAILAAQKAGAGLAILDDGLQYGGVAKDLEVVVLDARWPRGGGPIPVGSARVPLSWLGKADVVWVNHGHLPAELRPLLRKDVVVVEARYEASHFSRRGQIVPLDALPDRPALAFAGVARPEGFFAMLRKLGVRIDRTLVFPDHHRFAWADLQAIEAWLDDHIVVTTEKDAARLPVDTDVFHLVVEPRIQTGESALRELLARRFG